MREHTNTYRYINAYVYRQTYVHMDILRLRPCRQAPFMQEATTLCCSKTVDPEDVFYTAHSIHVLRFLFSRACIHAVRCVEFVFFLASTN